MINDLLNPIPYNSTLLLQSTPGLLISLAGLILTGSVLTDAANDINLKNVPILLEANCILAFKGNIELIFAMYLSSMSQSPLFMYRKYFRYVFDNSNLVLTQSAIIGCAIGLIGMINNIISGEFDVGLNLAILAGSLISCVLTSLAFVALLIISIELSKLANINPDNIILPTISSLGDYINVRSLIHFTRWFKTIPPSSCLAYIFLTASIVPICLCFTLMSKKRLPLQSIEVLCITYAISTISGYVLENFRDRFTILTSAFPVFSGVSVAIAFIYLHRIFTSINNQTVHDSRESYVTLIFTSILMSITYLTISMFMGLNYSYLFCILFMIFFITQVMILLKGVTTLIVYLDKREGDTGVLTLPLITSISDILATAFLLAIAIILESSGTK